MTAPCTPADLSVSVTGARAACATWAAQSVRRRLRPVEALRRLLVAHTDSLCQVIGDELGKRPAEVIGGEILPTADACRFLLRQAARLLAPRRVGWFQTPLWMFGQHDTVYRRPRGVVGIIGTWNYPLFLNAIQVVQALTAGNAVLWKPSEVTPRFAQLLGELIHAAGYPPGLFHCLPATRDMGAVLANAAVDHIVFTGSASVGRRLAAQLGERLISSTLELSGCDALFVLDDADVKLAARAAWFGMNLNRGQTCIAARRAFVPRARYADFCSALCTLAGQAPPVRLALKAQVVQARRLVDEALADGARLLCPEHDTAEPEIAELACHPAILVDARPEMSLCQEASFAPLLAVLPVDTMEDALVQDAACPYALGASIFTRSLARAESLARRLRAGLVQVNDVVIPIAHPATPFGGRGHSGWGTTQGPEGLLEMTVPQVVSWKGGSFRPHFDLTTAEGNDRQEGLLRGLLHLSHGRTLGERLRGWWRLIRDGRQALG